MASFDQACEVEKGHGRVEVRSLPLTTWLADYLAPEWPACTRVDRLKRELRSGDKVESEVIFGITSLPREQAGAVEPPTDPCSLGDREPAARPT